VSLFQEPAALPQHIAESLRLSVADEKSAGGYASFLEWQDVEWIRRA